MGEGAITWAGGMNTMKDESSTDTYISLLLDSCFMIQTLHLMGCVPSKSGSTKALSLFSCRVLGKKSN